MRKFLTLLLLLFCCFSLTAWAKEKKTAEPQPTAVQTAAEKSVEDGKAAAAINAAPSDTEKAATSKASKSKKKKAAKDELETCIPRETITVDAMQQRLKHKSDEDLLYIKIGDSTVEVYTGLATDRSLRKQLILKLPNTEMLRLYTTNKATYEQMQKMLADYESSNTNFKGYRIITDKDSPQKLEDGGNVYRFWFMKIEREKASRRRGGFPIGIGIGIGGGHHHRHGPWVGVGL